jgi:hypothetical protein
VNYRMQTMFPGGTNNYVFDSNSFTNTGTQYNAYPPQGQLPTGTIQIFELPRKWKDGAFLLGAQVQFASFISYSGGGAQYEIAFSKCKGDFEYYKTPQASVSAYGQTFQTCGIVWGADVSLGWSIGDASIYSCGIPAGETWYMNWRVVPGTCINGSYTCGQTFAIPRG